MSKSHVRALRIAREMIVNKQETFVCLALQYGNNYSKPAMDVVRWINTQLDDDYKGRDTKNDTLSTWLLNRGYDISVPDRFGSMRECRLRWIDWMIENHTIFDK